jgi:PIN domain nuclease of toxin-antitoxin system
MLAVIHNERGADRVVQLMRGALMSTANVAEVQSKLILNGVQPDLAWRAIASFQCEICPLSTDQARIAGDLARMAKPLGLSLGDRACLALAMQRNATVYTADRAFKGMNVPIKIDLIR